ncbi:MAG: acyltransferase, partial [Candidatus Lokiarchaeota archaeon]|nr:acyltransferase [Candidatus Lokiarchaeota archaeon]
MRAGFIQFDCKFGEAEENYRKVKIMLAQEQADLWVLPEFFHSGYLFQKKQEVEKLAEEIPDGQTTQFLIEQAKRHNTTIVAGLAERDGDKFYNSAICVNGMKGFLGKYRKIHLFDREKLFFEPGDMPFSVIDLGTFKLGIMICF